MKFGEKRTCEICGGTYQAYEGTDERTTTTVDTGGKLCTCSSTEEDANQAAARIVREATEGK